MKSKISILGYIMFAMLLLSTCLSSTESVAAQASLSTATNNIIEDQDSGNSISYPSVYKNTLDGIVFEAKLEIPRNFKANSLQTSTATLIVPDAESTLQTFSANKEILEKESYNGTVDSQWIKFDDGSELYFDVSLSYRTPFASIVDSVFINYAGSHYNADKYLSNGVEEEVKPLFNKILNYIQDVGYNLNDFEYSYYKLDYKTMQEQENYLNNIDGLNNSFTASFNEEDDCYYLYGQQMHQHIPIYFGYSAFPEDDEVYNPVQAIFSTRGLELLLLNNLYDCTITGNKVSLVSFDVIANNIARKYSSILSDAQYKVVRAKLYYFPVKTYDTTYNLKIGWLIEIEETGIDKETNDEYKNIIYTFIDGESGEELLF